jgi:hypothetical protein
MRSTPPTRLVDTRSSPGERVPGAITRVRTTDRAGVPGPADVGMVALNITVTEPERAGFAAVSPCDGTRARTSSLNFEAGATVANAVLVAPASTGDVCVDVDAGAHVIVDLIGWVPATSDLQPVPPARLADTRTGSTTVDGRDAGTGALGAGGIVAVDVLGRAGVPVVGVAAVALNVTTTSSRRDGFLTVHPCGTVVPATSTLNHLEGRSVAGAAVVRLGDGDRVCVFSDAPGDVVVDVTGYVSR